MSFWRLGVIGSPITHSLSPQLHAAGLAYLGLEGSSLRVQVDAQHASTIRELMESQFDAVSVTMPLKALAATMCDELDVRARELGVVNSLRWSEGVLSGASTDGAGFIDSLRGEFAASVSGMHAVVLGSGGAARAVVDELVREEVSSVTLLGRNPRSVQALVERYERVIDHGLAHRRVDLIVNTTPSRGRDETGVIEGVTSDTICVDITYDPRMTEWMDQHRQLGCRVTNGLGMLAFTVARQMNWWWDSDIPGAYLLDALTKVLQ